MILYCNFEELAALTAAITRVLEAQAVAHGVQPAADSAPVTPVPVAELEALLPRLVGDVTIDSLADHAAVRRALAFITDDLRARMDAAVLDQHPAAEDAVLAYFDYAHALSVLDRLEAMGREMSALAAIMTGQAPDSEAARRFTFPD